MKRNRKEDKKEKKTKKKSMPKNILNLLPVRIYDDTVDAFLNKNGRYMDLIKIIPRDLENISDDELNIEIMNMIKIFKTVGIDLKFISINFPLNTKQQRESLYEYKERASDLIRIKWIERQIEELNRADKGILTREFYILIYGESKDQFIKNKELVTKYTCSGFIRTAEFIGKEQKIHILNKISNMNTEENLFEELNLQPDLVEMGDEKVDIDLIEKLQPRGGISFSNPSYIRFGDGYIRCLRVYTLPTYINEFWLMSLFNIPNCICTFDVSSKDMAEVKKNINKSITEEQARASVAKNYEEAYNANKRKEELESLFDNVSRLGEVIKLCDFRIFIKSLTLEELEEQTETIFKNLEADGYKTSIMLNEQKSEWLSIFEPFSEYHKRPFTMRGLVLTSEQLAEGYPFNYSELIDKNGVLLGFSKTGGVILYDQFTKTAKRKHYNAVVCGDMGSGKSTHLKKMFKHNASLGNYVRTFDISGEFSDITEEFGGKIIKCNGSEGMLNPLEILRAGDDDYISYSNHISKLLAFFRCIIPSMSDELEQELSNQLQALYTIFELNPDDNREITGLAADKYPTLTNFKVYLERSIEGLKNMDKESETDVETNLYIDKARNLNNLLGAVENLVNNYGKLFDGYSTIDDISREKIVTFDISSIKDLGTIFTAQMQNLVSLCWDNAVANGKSMKNLWDEHKEETMDQDITKFLVLIDESHRWVNTSMPLILDMITRYMREARKYFAGIVLASQSVRDFIPQATDKDLERIRALFEFSQYKFMFKQSSSAQEHIQTIFGAEMTSTQVSKIPYLEVGETIMSISGDRTIEFKEWLSKEYEERLFAGGR